MTRLRPRAATARAIAAAPLAALLAASALSFVPAGSLAAQAPTTQPPAAPSAPGGAPPRSPRGDSLRTAYRLDVEGRTAEARAIMQALLAGAPSDSARAPLHRAIALSYAFDGDCANTVKHEEAVIAYWRTREAVEPQNAHYQQGEMANEAARVCIDAGQLDEAERLYKLGRELGLREPAPQTHPASLWEFRTHHAQARLAARRGQAAEARRHVEMARRTLDADSAMARQQRRFLPYLEGYVALYTGDAAAAEGHFRRTLAERGNENDPYFHYLLGESLERQGKAAEARASYQTAYDRAGMGHNPPAAFTRRAARAKLGGQ